MGEFGRDIAAKIKNNYDPAREQEALDWIGENIDEKSPLVVGNEGEALYNWLKDGVYLCQLLNKVKPGIIPKIVKKPHHVLEERQNIQAYLAGCRELGIPEQDLFDLGDLHSRTMIPAVVQNIFALGRQSQVISTYKGPQLGSKFSVSLEEQALRKEKRKEENDRRANFIRAKSEQQLLRREELEQEQRKDEIKKMGHTRQRSLTRQLSKGRISLTEFEKLSDENEKEIKQLENSTADLGLGQVVYGMDLELKKRSEEKYDVEREEQVMDWIESVTGTKMTMFYDDLKSGIVLCNMVNIFRPKSVPRINTRDTALSHRDNIQMYLTSCLKLGMQPSQLFSTSDLYEKRDLNSVLNHFQSLSQRVEILGLWKGPFLQRDGTVGPGRMAAVRAQSTPVFLGEKPRSLSCAELPSVPLKKKKDLRMLGDDLSPVKPSLISEEHVSTAKPVRFESPTVGRRRTQTLEIVITPESPVTANRPSESPKKEMAPSALSAVPSPSFDHNNDKPETHSTLDASDTAINAHDSSEFDFEDRSQFSDLFSPTFWFSNIVSAVSNLRYMFLRG